MPIDFSSLHLALKINVKSRKYTILLYYNHLKRMKKQNYIGIGIALGAGIGAALGTALQNIAMGVGLGTAAGIIIGVVMSQAKNGGSNPDE